VTGAPPSCNLNPQGERSGRVSPRDDVSGTALNGGLRSAAGAVGFPPSSGLEERAIVSQRQVYLTAPALVLDRIRQ
jgi:hypothetical protein